MKLARYAVVAVAVAVLLSFGCAHMRTFDPNMTKIEHKLNPTYGQVTPTIPFEQFKYYTGEPEPFKPYTKMAEVIIQGKPAFQEKPPIIYTKTPDDMLKYMCKSAWENGADAVINVSVGTENIQKASTDGSKLTVHSGKDSAGLSWSSSHGDDEPEIITFSVVKGIAVRFNE